MMKHAVTILPAGEDEAEPGPAASAAALRRRIEAGAGGAAEWLAYAAALAALGFHDRARRAEAQAIGGAPAPARPAPRPRPRPVDPGKVRVYLSGCQPRLDERDAAAMAGRIGTADYSYGFAMRGFCTALARIGVAHEIIVRPELVPDIRERSDAGINLHLGFYPAERLRLLKGAFNILCFAWEFDRLRLHAERTDPHAFADQATMLNCADMLWVPSAHGTAAVARSVAVPVRTVPAPVFESLVPIPRRRRPPPAQLAELARGVSGVSWQPLAILPRLQPEMDRLADQHRHSLAQIVAGIAREGPPTLFVAILNVHDYRKQLRPLLEGFAAFARRRRDAVLLVKASTPERGRVPINALLLAEQMSAPGERSPPILSDRVWITDDVMTRGAMDRLYDAAAFIVSVAHAEGQNLPLIEAMGRGAVPVSVDHSAMADYIRPDNAVPIASTQRPFDLRLARRYGMFGLETRFVAAADVRAALDAAMALGEADYAARSAAALATVRAGYGPDRLLVALREAIADARRGKAALG